MSSGMGGRRSTPGSSSPVGCSSGAAWSTSRTSWPSRSTTGLQGDLCSPTTLCAGDHTLGEVAEELNTCSPRSDFYPLSPAGSRISSRFSSFLLSLWPAHRIAICCCLRMLGFARHASLGCAGGSGWVAHDGCCPGAEMLQLPCDAVDKVDRPVSTAIYFMLPTGSVSHLHRIPCAETWHFYKGEPLTVFELHDDGEVKFTILGTDLESGQLLQYTVPPNTWFGSFPTKDVETYATDGSSLVLAPSRDPDRHYSLVGCTCAPAFPFEDFEMAKYDEIAPLAPKG